MHVGFTEDQLELRANVRDVLERECPPATVREAIEDAERWRPLWKTVTDLGWTALAELDDEAGLGVVELVAVLEEAGAAALPAPLLSSAGLAGGVLRGSGVDAVAELAGGAVGALGAMPAGGRLPGAPLQCAAGRVTGRVAAVADAERAQLLVLLATEGDQHVAAVVRPGDGVTLHPGEAVDPARPLADLEVDASAEAVVPIDLHQALAVPLTAAAAELLGLTNRLLDMSVAHATTREQFGRAIGGFQGVKHRLADCYVGLERARSLTYAAAMSLTDDDAPAAQRWQAAVLAKAAASEAATEAARAAVQVHGAIAQTWEHDVHLYLRRAWQSAALLGEPRALYREVGALLAGRA